jgi:hypothetical protein
MGKKELLLLIVGFMLSSCFALHPELQQAKSLGKGENAYAGGLYGGANTLSPIYGIAGLHNYGLTDYVDWSTDGAFSVQANSLTSAIQGFGISQYNLTTGPKFSLFNNRVAFRFPATVTLSAGDLFLSTSPTLLWDILDERATLFVRYNRLYASNALEGYAGDALLGFNYFVPFHTNQLLFSIQTNGLGVYGGIGILL